MKRFFFIVSMLLAFTSTSFAQKKAEIKLERTKFDFGTINLSKVNELSREFVITNTGDADLVISKISSSKNDVTAECVTKKIAPGEKGTVKVKFNPGMKNGNVDLYLLISSNAKNNADTVRISSKMVTSIKSTMVMSTAKKNN